MSQNIYTGIGAALLDTGIYPHIDFDKRIIGFQDMVHHRQQPYDDNGHGTHVAGVLGGSGRASRGKYRGIAPNCNLVGIKVLDEKGNGNKEYVMRALEWIGKNKEKYNIRIVNISVGTPQRESQTDLIEAVEYLWDQGLVIVAAAGNMGPGMGSITAPGSSRKIITVGSSDMMIKNQGLSGRGPTNQCICKPDVVAPGNEIVSCSNKAGGFFYTVKSGTSMSTPIVAGGIAVLLEKKPWLSNLEIKKLIRQTAQDMGYPHNIQGWGVFQLEKFLSV